MSLSGSLVVIIKVCNVLVLLLFVIQQRPISVLKVDTEGAEWPFLRDVIVHDPTQLADVSQLIFELHSLTLPNKLTKSNLEEMIYYVERLVDSSSDGQGFVVRGSNHTLNCCGVFAPLMPCGVPDRCAYEVFLLNARFHNGV